MYIHIIDNMYPRRREYPPRRQDSRSRVAGEGDVITSIIVVLRYYIPFSFIITTLLLLLLHIYIYTYICIITILPRR